MNDSLEERLTALNIAVPATLVPRVLRAAARPVALTSKRGARRRTTLGRRTAFAAVGVLAVIGGANLTAAHYFPAYGQALADAPIAGILTGPLLRESGLVPSQVTSFNDVAVSSGHKVHLVGGYADSLRTLLFLEVDDKGFGDPGNPIMKNPADQPAFFVEEAVLTDQFGEIYQELPYVTAATVAGTVPFEPLRGQASIVGARLTLTITKLQAYESDETVEGDWKLRANLSQESGHDLPLPAPIQVADATYTFTSIRSTSGVIAIQWTVTGAAVDRLRELIPTGPGGLSAEYLALQDKYFTPRLISSDGHSRGAGGQATLDNVVAGEMVVVLDGPGQYRVRFGSAVPEQTIIVP